MHFETNSLFGFILFLCGGVAILAVLPLTIIWRVRSTYKEMQQGEPRWKSSATYHFITNPKNKLTVQIVAGVMLLFTLTMFLGLVGLVVYLAVISGSRGWVVLLLFLAPLLAGIVFAPILFIIAHEIRKKVRRDYLARNPE